MEESYFVSIDKCTDMCEKEKKNLQLSFYFILIFFFAIVRRTRQTREVCGAISRAFSIERRCQRVGESRGT